MRVCPHRENPDDLKKDHLMIQLEDSSVPDTFHAPRRKVLPLKTSCQEERKLLRRPSTYDAHMSPGIDLKHAESLSLSKPTGTTLPLLMIHMKKQDTPEKFWHIFFMTSKSQKRN